MKISATKKKELLKLLYKYFSLKPEKDWVEGARIRGDKHCALGFLDHDFSHTERIHKDWCYENVVTGTVMAITKEEFGYGIVEANNGHTGKARTPKRRVLSYIRKQIKSLS